MIGERIEFQVNAYTTSTQSTPSVAIDYDGDFVIGWHSYGEDAASGNGIYARRFSANGALIGPEILVNTYTTNYQSFVKLGMDYRGDMVATWASAVQDGSSAGLCARSRLAQSAAAQLGHGRRRGHTRRFARSHLGLSPPANADDHR